MSLRVILLMAVFDPTTSLAVQHNPSHSAVVMDGLAWKTTFVRKQHTVQILIDKRFMHEDYAPILRGSRANVQISAPVGPRLLVLRLSSLILLGYQSSGQGMVLCDDHTYCCDGEDCSCANGTGTVSIGAGALAFTTIGVYLSQSVSLQMTPLQTSESEFHSNSLSTVLLPTATTSNNNTITSTRSSSLEPQPTNTVSSAQPQASDKSCNPKKIGIGVGVPVGCLLTGAIAFLVLWRERRLKRQMRRMQECWNPAAREVQGPLHSGCGPLVNEPTELP